jgi:hypothetical protein
MCEFLFLFFYFYFFFSSLFLPLPFAVLTLHFCLFFSFGASLLPRQMGPSAGSSCGSSAPDTGSDTEGQSTRHGNHGLTFQLTHPVSPPLQERKIEEIFLLVQFANYVPGNPPDQKPKSPPKEWATLPTSSTQKETSKASGPTNKCGLPIPEAYKPAR